MTVGKKSLLKCHNRVQGYLPQLQLTLKTRGRCKDRRTLVYDYKFLKLIEEQSTDDGTTACSRI